MTFFPRKYEAWDTAVRQDQETSIALRFNDHVDVVIVSSLYRTTVNKEMISDKGLGSNIFCFILLWRTHYI